jgi:hypothetical protein
MIISFTLSMPGVASWNGKWTGDGVLYAKMRHFGRKKESKELAEKILAKHYFTYRWPDGWCASVTAKEVSSAEAAKIRRKSQGFHGYDWMIDCICNYLEIPLYGQKDA